MTYDFDREPEEPMMRPHNDMSGGWGAIWWTILMVLVAGVIVVGILPLLFSPHAATCL